MRRLRSILSLLFCYGVVVACGSRTGLFADGPKVSDGGVIPDAGLDGKVPCTPGEVGLGPATAQLMFVLDRSGSMNFEVGTNTEAPPGFPTRWTILRDALEETIVPFDNQLAMGAKFFPEEFDPNEDSAEIACQTDPGVPIPPALGNARAIIDVFDTTEPLGGTPTAQALRIASQDLAQRRTVARTIILATDGAPNCNPNLDVTVDCTCTTPLVDCGANPDRGRYSCLDDTNTIATVADIFQNQKIPVYVIGIGSIDRPDFLEVLNQMAVAGGRPRAGATKHYNVQSAQELSTAIATIRDSIAKCTYLTPSAPDDANSITVDIDGRQIPRDPTHQNGWDWIDQSYGVIGFFGSACTAAGGPAKVTGVVTCADR